MDQKEFNELDSRISKMFNKYPIEERKKIIIHILQMQIRTIQSNKREVRRSANRSIDNMTKWQNELYEELINVLEGVE